MTTSENFSRANESTLRKLRTVWVPGAHKKSEVSAQVRSHLRSEYGDGGWNLDIRLDLGSKAYLRGLRDAGCTEVQVLLDAIDEHGAIIVRDESW